MSMQTFQAPADMLDVLTFRFAAAPSPPRLLQGQLALGPDSQPSQRRALSVLIPFFNEAGNIHPLLDEVHAAMVGVDYEIVCVNDCSSDATAAELAAATQQLRSSPQIALAYGREPVLQLAGIAPEHPQVQHLQLQYLC